MDVIAWLRARPVATDVAVTAVVAVPTAMDAWWNEAGTRQADAVTYVLTIVSVAVLLLRRRHPFATALISGSALSGLYVLGHHGELLNLPVIVALYTVASQSDRRTTVVTGVVAGAWSGILGFTSDDPIGARGGSPMLEIIWPLVPLALGEASRSRRELLAHTAAEREREAERRVEVEQARMARELHDVVAHTMAAVNVQMAAAIAAFDTRPEVARRALHQARGSTRDALHELRATVSLLRAPGDGVEPAPRLDQIGVLTDTVRSAGIAVTVHDDRRGADLPTAVELAAYRVVQEALTNVIRHSDGRQVVVALTTTTEGLVVDVADDGGPTAVGDGRAGGGFGLAGMSERAGALGGHVTHGPCPSGGYRVRAVLPLDGAATGKAPGRTRGSSS